MDVDKRYGRMFIGGWAYPARPNKRYGRMFFGGYPGSSYLFGGQKDKRFGRLFANGYGYPSNPSGSFVHILHTLYAFGSEQHTVIGTAIT
jgi:hypothetical protein